MRATPPVKQILEVGVGRILVVDDDPAMSALIELHLERGHHTVQVANCAQDAIAMATGRTAPEVVVLDVAMPDMSGFELLTELRSLKDLSALPAVFLSARVTAADIEAGRNLGATYLTKPFVASALMGVVNRLLEDAAIALCASLEERMVEPGHSNPMVLSDDEHQTMQRLSGGHNAAQAKRARVVLLGTA
jgi:DNA-binding response OmpR family regulator